MIVYHIPLPEAEAGMQLADASTVQRKERILPPDTSDRYFIPLRGLFTHSQPPELAEECLLQIYINTMPAKLGLSYDPPLLPLVFQHLKITAESLHGDVDKGFRSALQKLPGGEKGL